MAMSTDALLEKKNPEQRPGTLGMGPRPHLRFRNKLDSGERWASPLAEGEPWGRRQDSP